jgi:hypothetical protein
MSNSAPNPYALTEGYAGVNASMMFTEGGSGPWGNIVRGCLACMHAGGADMSTAHSFCYQNGFQRTSALQGTIGFVRAVVGAINIYVAQVEAAQESAGQGPAWAIGPWWQGLPQAPQD